MNIMRPAVAAVLASSIAMPALAETQQSISLTPFAGYQLFDDKRDLDESATYGLGIEYRFLPNWAVEAVYSRANADRKYENGDSEFEELRLDGTYYFAGPDAALNPYLSAGIGHADFGIDDAPNAVDAGKGHDETRVNIGGGVRYHFNDMVSVRGELREFHGVDESTFDTLASLGLSLAFHRTASEPMPADADGDGVTDANDRCPGTPAGVKVDTRGCELDNDNDGVANSKDQCPTTPAGAKVNRRGCELDNDRDGVVNSKDECPNTTAGAQVNEQGCEGVTQTVETIELSIQFPTNSAEIGAGYDAELRRVAEYMAENPETVAEIAGHTDSLGAAAYNQQLSERRAQAVADRLVSVHGIAADRVSAVGYGEAEPVASNETAAGRADNRRVEARIQVLR